jgi:uncharacterized protein (DUF1015 family)
LSNVCDNPDWIAYFGNSSQSGEPPIKAATTLLLQSNVSMADVHPFRAFRYDSKKVSPSQVLTQPYDKITPSLQDHYYAASPHNLVRIILGRREENDNLANNVYSRAAAHFRDWRQQTILRQDSLPSIYVYSQRFTPPDSTTALERRGFIALGRLEDYSAGVVFRHEQTLAKPKADRLDLLRATRAHFGQLFMLYEDSGQLESLLSTPSPPAVAVADVPTDVPADVQIKDENGVIHRVWQVTDPHLINSIQAAMSDKKLIIADGHHRYETALAYRDECRAADSSRSAPGPTSSPYEFAMMTFVNMNSPSLLILPTHRLVHSLPSFSEEDFRYAARAFFDIDEIDPGLDASRATAILRESGRCGTSILAVTANHAFLLHHPNPNTPHIFAGLSLRQQALDVVQLHKCLLERVLNLSEESIRNQQNISYIRDAAEALSQVRSATGPRANIAFLMNPCRMSQVRDIAFAGEVMPQKSTDFYPKLLSGLTIYALD